MKLPKLLYILTLSVLISSCVGENSIIQKRKYTNGYHVWGQGKKQKEAEPAITVSYVIRKQEEVSGKIDSVTSPTFLVEETEVLKEEAKIADKQPVPLDSIEDNLLYERVRTKKQLLTTGIVSILVGVFIALTELIALSPFIIILGIILILASVFITTKKDKAPLKERKPALHGCLSILTAIFILILGVSLIAVLLFGF